MVKNLFKGCLTVPNLLSVIRILLVPAFLILYLNGYPIPALLMIALSGLTDFFDGKIARKFNQISDMGKILDPIADKLTEISIAVALFVKFMQSNNELMKSFCWVFLVFILKELIMLLVGAFLLSRDIRPVASEACGKIATFVFYIVMFMVIAFGPEVGAFSSYNINMTMPDWMVISCVVVSLLLMIVALISYIPPVLKQYKEKKEENNNKVSAEKQQ